MCTHNRFYDTGCSCCSIPGLCLAPSTPAPPQRGARTRPSGSAAYPSGSSSGSDQTHQGALFKENYFLASNGIEAYTRTLAGLCS